MQAPCVAATSEIYCHGTGTCVAWMRHSSGREGDGQLYSVSSTHKKKGVIIQV